MDRKYWEHHGRDYDAEIFDVYAEDREGVLLRTVERLVAPGSRVADLGCGTGKALRFLADRAGTVEAVDLSASCLAEAQNICQGRDNITFRRADLSRDRTQGMLDFILHVQVLIMPDPAVRQAILRGISRRLNPGGKCLLVVPSLESSLWVARRLWDWEMRDGASPREARKTVVRLLGDRFRPALAEGVVPIDGVPTKHYLEEEIRELLPRMGLRVVACEKISYAWTTEFVDPPRWMGSSYPWDWMVVAEKGT